MNYVVYYKSNRNDAVNHLHYLFPMIEIEAQDSMCGAFVTDENGIDHLESMLPVFNHDQGIQLTCIVGFTVDQLSWKLLDKAQHFRKGKCSHVADVLLDCALNDNVDFDYELNQLFSDCPQELMLTVKEYLKCGMNAKRAADKMYLHRNTFNYRLAKFENVTGLDIRDYHAAQFVNFVLTICAQRTR